MLIFRYSGGVVKTIKDNCDNKYNIFLRNFIEDKSLENHLKKFEGKEIRLMNIWGARYDKRPNSYHLGHIYVLQKLKDIADDNNFETKIYIGIGSSKKYTDVIRQKEQKEYVETTKRLLIESLAPVDIDIKDFGDLGNQPWVDTAKYREVYKKYEGILSLIKKLSYDIVKDTEAINNESLPKIEFCRTLIDIYGVSQKVADRVYLAAYRFFNQGKVSLESDSELVLRLNLFSYTHLIARPDLIIASHRHRHHWDLYIEIFKLARLKNSPKIVYLDSLVLPNENGEMTSRSPSSIFIIDKADEIEDKLKDAKHSFDKFMAQCYDYVIFPNCGIINYTASKTGETVKIRGPYDLSIYGKKDIKKYLHEVMVIKLNKILRFYQKIINNSRMLFNKNEEKWLALSNSDTLEYLDEKFNVQLSDDNYKNIDNIHQNPENYNDVYWRIITKIVDVINLNKLELNSSSNDGQDLTSLLMKIRSMDFYLWLTQKTYRDHFSHMVNVTNGGLVLIEKIKNSNELSVLDIMISNFNLKSEQFKNDLQSFWIVTALLHDHAYPISHYLKFIGPRIHVVQKNISKDIRGSEKKVWKNLSNALSDYISQLADGNIRRIIEKLSDKSFNNITCYKEFLCQEFEPLIADKITLEKRFNEYDIDDKFDIITDHGVLGCINLYETTGADSSILKPKDYWFPIDYIADAIAVHNHEKFRKKLNFKDNPFAYILLLIDEVQEWGRNSINDKDYSHPIPSIRIGPFFENFDGEYYILDNRLVIRFNVSGADHRKDLGWDLKIFEDSKRKALGRLEFPIINFEGKVLLDQLSYEVKAEGRVFPIPE